MRTTRSQAAFEQAKRFLVGGVNSPVRSFHHVGGTPPFIERAQGSRLWDVDGNEYVDLVLGWGPLILGHAHPEVRKAIVATAELGWGYGAPTEREHALAAEVQRRMPSLERMRFVTSGTEATMSALRVARAHTRRSDFIKFEGCYHGHADAFLSRAGSGLATSGVPDSAGVPAHVAGDARTLPYNDLDAVERLLRAESDRIAAVLVEPVAANMGLVPPEEGFLPGLREACDRHDVVLIFDEVVTGFRASRGGAQERYGVRPDLTTLGKVLGGGLPLAAYGGRGELMSLVAPEGPVYQAGTLSGNPLAVAAGAATLRELTDATYERLERLGDRLERGLRATRPKDHVARVGSMLGVFQCEGPVRAWSDARRANPRTYATWFHAMLRRGVYLPPSPFETMFLSVAHTEREIDDVVTAAAASHAAPLTGSVAA